jgi:DNA-directed RNA polymerase subunit M/transcription elongation factor TFIIS
VENTTIKVINREGIIMFCPKCGSDKVNIQIVQTGAKSSTKGKGCLFSIGRLLLIICTCGLWLVFGKKKAKTKTTFQNQKMAICQNCGNQWNV